VHGLPYPLVRPRGVVTAELATPAEDQVIARLEARNPGPRPVPSPEAPLGSWPETPPAPMTSPQPAPGTGAGRQCRFRLGNRRPARHARGRVRPAAPPRPAYPPRAEPSATLAPASIPPASRRLSLNPAAPRQHRAASRRSGGRFVLGFLFALMIGGAAFGAYEYADEIADRLPAARPALERHVALVDEGRTWVDSRVTPEIERLLNR
jgi:hypothetical protein